MAPERSSASSSKAKISSCAECVRLKLKCSRSWPCTSCVKRGCQNLCPDEAMQPRDTLAMQKTIRQLQDEVASLKAALKEAQQARISPRQVDNVHSGDASNNEFIFATLSHEDPPVWSGATDPASKSTQSSFRGLRDSEEEATRGVWTQLADDCNLSAAAGPGMNAVVSDEDVGGFLGRGAGALYVWDQDSLGIEAQTPSQATNPGSEAGADLSFPSWLPNASDLSQLHCIWPTKQEARPLLEAYYNRVEWMYAPTNSAALRTALDGIYSAASIDTGLRRTHPHRLATIALAVGLGDLFLRNPKKRALELFSAASALLTTKRAHYLVASSIASIEALHMMVTFLFATGEASAAKAAWPLLGQCMRLVCALGLHRDSGEWGISGADKTHRDILAWECITYDILYAQLHREQALRGRLMGSQSLNFGRPYSLPRSAIECPIPNVDEATEHLTVEDVQFHQVKYRLAAIFAQIADCVHARELPDYTTVLAIDKMLRQAEADAPPWLRWREGQEHPLPVNGDTMKMISQQHMVGLLLHKGLLALHRPWYTISLSTGAEPLMCPQAGSFTTCVSSARKHTQLMNSLLRLCPDVPRTWWFFPFHTFTAAVIQATILLRQPQCMMSTDIKDDFDASFSVMARTAETSSVARRSMQILSRLNERIQSASSSHYHTLANVHHDASMLTSEMGHNLGTSSSVASDVIAPFDPTPMSNFPSDPTSLLMMDRIPAAFDDPVFLAQLDSYEHTLYVLMAQPRY